MKTAEDIAKEHGWRPGLYNDNFSKRYAFQEYRNARKLAKKKSNCWLFKIFKKKKKVTE